MRSRLPFWIVSLAVVVFYVFLLAVPCHAYTNLCFLEYGSVDTLYARIRYTCAAAPTSGSLGGGYNYLRDDCTYQAQYQAFGTTSYIPYADLGGGASICATATETYAGKPLVRYYFTRANWSNVLKCNTYTNLGDMHCPLVPNICNANSFDTSRLIISTCGPIVLNRSDATLQYMGCFAGALNTVDCPDYDCDGSPNSLDCASCDANRYPGAVEICGNSRDEDCNGLDLSCSVFNPNAGTGTMGIRAKGTAQFKEGRKGRGAGGYQILKNMQQ